MVLLVLVVLRVKQDRWGLKDHQDSLVFRVAQALKAPRDSPVSQGSLVQ